MTCRPPAGCGAQFCWHCRADYLGPGGILAVGNIAHHPACRYHWAPTAEPVQPLLPLLTPPLGPPPRGRQPVQQPRPSPQQQCAAPVLDILPRPRRPRGCCPCCAVCCGGLCRVVAYAAISLLLLVVLWAWLA
jgi:hypothetical protein